MQALNEKDCKKALALLSKRPGEFARKLDHMLRISVNANIVVNGFKSVATDVSTPVLLQVKEHFSKRNDTQSDIRVFFPKGNVSKAYHIENTLPTIEERHCKAIVQICEFVLMEHYKQKEFLGNVYLSEAYKSYIVPFSQRSASKALKSIVRGSRFAIEENTTVLRGFLWWKNGDDRTDIDLSAVFYDEKWQQPYCDLPECFGGWMMREDAESGEIYEPRTVQNKFDISTNCSVCIPMIFDLVDRVLVWADMGLTDNPQWSNNVEGNKYGIAATCKAIVEMKKPNLYDLLALHIKARGLPCESKEEADIVFDIEDGIMPSDTEVFMAEYI